MKKIICLLLISFAFASQADLKDVLKKIPKKYDTVFKVDVQKVLGVESINKKIVDDPKFKEMQKNLKDKLNLTEKDILSVYMCGNSTQFYDLKGLQDINFDSLIFIELAKPLDFEAVKKELPAAFAKVKEVNGIKCISIENKQMRNPQAAFVTPKMIMICPDYCLQETLTMKPENSILTNKKIVEMLTENGFGGIVSIVHAAVLQKVPPVAPWLKDYRGGIFNIFFEKSSGLDVELSTNFSTVDSVKSASLMVGVGLNFLDMKPELKEFKDLVKFRVHENNLFIDFNLSPEMLKKMENMVANGISDRAVRVEERRKLMEERRKAGDESQKEEPKEEETKEFQ
jgi:hypothetical protein